MSIISERIEGKIISVDINSTNIKNAVYDTEAKSLEITFNNNTKYSYEDVPWDLFTKFRMSDSQGRFFSQNISKNYKYQKIS